MKTFLHVGCGPSRQAQTPFEPYADTWRETTMDVDVNAAPDILGSMIDMSAVKDASFDAVYSSHSIEHLYPHEVPVALAQFRRVLKPDGFILITCPDLQSVCALVAEGKLTEAAYTSTAGPIAPLDILYGHRPALAAGELFMAPRTGFTRESLLAEIKAAGFIATAITRRGAPHYDLWAVSFASRPTEEVVRAQAAAFFPAA